MKVLFPIILFLTVFSFSYAQVNFKFLEGTWKVEGKNQFEEWHQVSEIRLEGSSFKIINGEKIISEYITILKNGNSLIYEATVLNQNDGETITFHLNKEAKDRLSFENERHDFPKKIQYLKIADKKLKVIVLGEDDKGFSLFMERLDKK